MNENAIVKILGRLSKRWLVAMLLGVLVLASLAVRLPYLDLPGPQGDEVYMPYVALLAKMNDPIGNPKINALGHQFPLTIGPYQGALPVYVYLLILQFGFHPLLFRIVNILGAALAVILLYKLAKELWGSDRLGLMAAALLALMPASVFYGRIGEFSVFIRVPIFIALALLTYKFFMTYKSVYFYMSCFVLGLALNVRLDGIWWVPTFLVWGLVMHLRTRRSVSYPGLLRGAILGSVVLFIGSIPYSLYVIMDWQSILHYLGVNSSVTLSGADNRLVLQNLITRFREIFAIVDGTALSEIGISPLVHGLPSGLALWSGMACGAFLVVRGLVLKKPQFGLEFTLSGLLLITGCSVITLSIFKPWHILMVLPFAILLMVVAVEQVIRRNKYIGFGLLGILLFSNLFAVAGDYRGLVEKRGSLGFSPAIYDLTRYLQDQRIQSVTTGDWGLARLIYYLSNGQVKTRECFVYGPHPPMPRWYYTRIDETLKQDSVWVFYVPNKGDTESQTAFTEYLAKQSVDPKVETISDSYGPLFNIYRIPKK